MMQYLAVKRVSNIADSPAHWTMTTILNMKSHFYETDKSQC